MKSLKSGEIAKHLGGIGGTVAAVNIRTEDGKDGWVA